MVTGKNTIIKIKTNNLKGNGTLQIHAQQPIRFVTFTAEDNNGKSFRFTYENASADFSGDFSIQSPVLWSVSNPYLYTYALEIEYEKERENVVGTFGFRTLTTNGKEICLNGTPIFVRGYIRGTTAHDHANNAGLSEEEFYRKNITEAKKFGFNYVRFHSVVPSETFFKVADELGILAHIELRPPHDIYNNLEEMVTTGSAVVPTDFLTDVIDRLHDHPSLAVYCIGNEIKNAASSAGEIEKIKRMIDEQDGTRLFLDTCAWGENNRPNVDMDVQHMSYYFPFGRHADMYEDTDNLLVVGKSDDKPMQTAGDNAGISRTLFFRVPLIAHEVCHYTALRDNKTLKEKFIKYGAKEPWWIDEELKMIESKGFTERYGEMYKASKDFQRECWKTAYEAMRTSSLLGGFHFLQFADTDVYENSNGVVDCFDDENYIRPEEFLKFNGDRVLVAKLGGRLYNEEQEIVVPVQFSNCGEDNEKTADFAFELVGADGRVAAKAEICNIDVSRKGLYEICKIKVRMPAVNGSEKFLFKTTLSCGGALYSQNEWKIWVHQKDAPISYRDFVSYENGDVMITDDVEKAFNGLKTGKKVCFVYRADWTRHVANKGQKSPEYAFRATWNRFKPVIWDRGTNYGGICEKALLEKHGFATEKYYDVNYSVLSEDCDKIILDDFPIKVHNIISGIDKSCRDRFDAYKGSFNLPELMYDRTLRDFSYLFDLQVGKGKLLVCGLNMTGLDKNEPSTLRMARAILSYMASDDFAPTATVSLEELQAYMRTCAQKPVKERMMTQFWQLDDAPVESPQFWKDSRAYLTEKE